ncbi:DUF4328 domain-containing protein [Haloferula sp. BvORR071]|uniref:DUF4328 domain-containing protein n=1 Tax=Haloferula sp. BvORR071 TaxID=1396141 RepID=UPI00054F7CC3|nr:DUF4328 domain-containing protein [Haloferula sp. BvORR071]
MDPEDANNPYLPPVTASPPVPEEKGPLIDPRLRGGFAAGMILVNLLIFLSSAFVPPSWYDRDILSALLTGSRLIAIVAFLVWFHACATNAKKMHRGGGVSSPGWAVGCFFIPFVNWAAPCLVMIEVVKSTFRHRPAREMSYVPIVWWISFLTWNVSLRWSDADAKAAWVSIGAVLTAAGAVTWLIARISITQAAFRWTDLPDHERPTYVPPLPAGSVVRPVPAASADGRPRMLPNVMPTAPRPVKPPAGRLVPPPPPRRAAPAPVEPEGGEA